MTSPPSPFLLRLVLAGVLFGLAGCHQRGSSESDPVLISGGGKYILTPSNGRALCNFSGQDKNFTIACRAAVLKDGVQHYADGLENGVSLTWAPPERVSGVAIRSHSCPRDNRSLAWSCDVTLAAAFPSRVQVNLDIEKSGVKTTEFAQLALLSVFSFGLPPQAPFDYITPGPERRSGATHVGFRSRPIDPLTTYLGQLNSACSMNGVVYFSAVNAVYALRDGKATIFAGSPNPANFAELSHPTRVFLPNGVKLTCRKDPSTSAPSAGDAVYLSSYRGHRVFRATVDSIGHVAGRLEEFFTGGNSLEGEVAKSARLNGPSGVALGNDGSTYFATTLTPRVLRVDPQGRIWTVAGANGDVPYGEGEVATSSGLLRPNSVAVLGDGSVLVAEGGRCRLRRIGPDGLIRTFAGSASPGACGDWEEPRSLVVQGDTAYFISGQHDTRVRLLRNGVLTTPAWSSSLPGSAVEVSLSPEGLLTIIAGDRGVFSLHRVDPATGVRTVLAGGVTAAFAVRDQTDTTQAQLGAPRSVRLLGDGSLVATFSNDHRIRKIDAGGVITTVAGQATPGFSGDGGRASAAELRDPGPLTVTADGSIYFGDNGNFRIRRIDPQGMISTIAGNGVDGTFLGAALNGPATNCPLGAVVSLVASEDGAVTFTHPRWNYLVRVRPDGVLVALTPVPEGEVPGGFPGHHLPLFRPSALALTPSGELLFADQEMQQVRALSLAEGVQRTIAGKSNGSVATQPPPAEGSDALAHNFSGIVDIAVGREGIVYVADAYQGKIFTVGKASNGGYLLSTYLGGTSNRDCGSGGLITETAEASVSEDALRASASVMCLGKIRSLALSTASVDGTLVQETFALGQTLSTETGDSGSLAVEGSGNILRLQRTFREQP